jgi:hypothetical protein
LTPHALNANVLVLQAFFLISSGFRPNSGYWYWLYQKLCWEMTYVSNQTQGNGRHWKTNLLCDTSHENRVETHPTSPGIYVVEICHDLFGLALLWYILIPNLYSCKHEFYLGRLCLNIKTLFALHTQTSLLNPIFTSCMNLPSNW